MIPSAIIVRRDRMLETKRLILRPFLRSDAADVLEYLGKPAVHCFADMKLCSLAEAEREMERRGEHGEYYFAIVLKESGKVIGEIAAYPEERQGDTFSPCWMLNGMYQGKGYAYEAARVFFGYLFERKGARRIYAYAEEDNLPSRRLCERLGMRKEGEFKEFVSFVKNSDGTPLYENTIQYAVLKREWSGDAFIEKRSL